MHLENGTASRVLITGASGGLGEEFARLFAREGCALVLVARNSRNLNDLSSELSARYGIPVHASARDLSLAGEAEALYADVRDRGWHVDVLVNNAGFGAYGLFRDLTWEKTRDMIAVNIASLTYLTHAFLPGMVERGYGRVLNVASTAAFQAGPLMAVYYASKAYVLRFTEALAEENRGTGVTFTALCPGPIRTGFDAAAGIPGDRLAGNPLVSSPRVVAEYGYRAMVKGKIVAVEGVSNRIASFFVRFIPRALLLRIVRSVQEAKSK